MHVLAWLKEPEKHETGPVVVLSGPERSLKQKAIDRLCDLVLDGPDDPGLRKLSGKEAEWKSVRDELMMVSMWGDQRLLVIENADDFVSQSRSSLEKYVANPSKTSVLVLDVKSWPKNTKLAKATVKVGLPLECQTLSAGELARWISDAAEEYQKKLSRNVASLMIDLAGTDLGLLERELEKLASYAGERDRITEADVRALVGGWKAETTWVMINSLRDGDLGESLRALDKLLVAGEAPQKILGGIQFVFRKFAKATEVAREGTQLSQALRDSGVFPRELNSTGAYLRRIGRPQAERISHLLMQIDTNMKGGSRLEPRLLLERLLVDLSGQLVP